MNQQMAYLQNLNALKLFGNIKEGDVSEADK